MSNQKSNFSAKGYYIALVLCAAAIGISGYLYYRGNDPQADVPAAVTQQDQMPVGQPNLKKKSRPLRPQNPLNPPYPKSR